MALSIKNPKADRLARELARATGESLTEAIVVSLEERLERVRQTRRNVPLRAQLAAIRERFAALPVLDDTPADEVLGFDERGLPT